MSNQYATAQQYRDLVTGAPTQQYTDEQLDTYLKVATINVEQFTERIFIQQEYTEVFIGDGRDSHLVYQYPIASVTSVDQATIAISPAVVSYDPVRFQNTTQDLASGRLRMDGLDTSGITTWAADQKYTVVYVGGPAAVPDSVVHATALWAAELLSPDYAGPRDGSTAIIPMLTEQILELLEPIRRRRV